MARPRRHVEGVVPGPAEQRDVGRQRGPVVGSDAISALHVMRPCLDYMCTYLSLSIYIYMYVCIHIYTYVCL